MAEIDGPSLRKVGTQTHRVAANWKLMVDAFLEVYHLRTVHPDNATLLYDDQTVTVAMLPHGHSRLTVAKRDGMAELTAVSAEVDNPSVPELWRETSTSFGVFPNLVVPMDTGAFTFLCMWPVDHRTTELELQWFAPAWGDGPVPDEHTARMTLFETVMAQDTANMSGIQQSIESPGARPFQIGWHERLIHHFQRAVDLAIGPDRVPPGEAVSDALDRFVE
jgi:phenylpropionate dioxygenase-like ring-hydroxylating dioxygenase large terminal subunit